LHPEGNRQLELGKVIGTRVGRRLDQVEEIKKIYLEKVPVLSRILGIAAVEMKDGLNLEIPEDRLINLIELARPEKKVDKSGEDNSKAMFPSGGGCDEYIDISA
jgi:hypothetical protein